jgi:hypothetical protein
MKYFEEAKNIWQLFVPKAGQAYTVQGELLRAVEKLRDEARRNGNMNWDEGFEILLNYVESKLTDQKVYSEATIDETWNILKRLKDFDNPYLKDDLYDELTDRVVEYFKFYGSQSHTLNVNLKR